MVNKKISCIVPARNEEGHLEQVILQILSFPSIDQIVIVEGGSSDDTFNEAKRIAFLYENRVTVIKQRLTGKFNAVLEGSLECNNDLILIWDADGTVPPDSTKMLIDLALTENNPVIGNRLLGNIEIGAMQRINWIGNWFFAFAWALLLNGRVSDLLCGTKIFPKEVFLSVPNVLQRIDPYGDFSLIITARLLGFSILDQTVDYKCRTYGETNIRRWRGAFRLLFVTTVAYWLFLKRLLSRYV